MWRAGTFAVLLLAATAPPAATQNLPDLVTRDALRVCADPGFLPFSNDRGEGFENRIAEVIGKALDLPVSYTWYPQTSGFLRNTLFAQRCDVVMGLTSGGGEAATTPAMYRTGYMLVTRSADGLAATSLGDPALAELRFGVIGRTPPADLLLAHDLITRTKVYPLIVDTRRDSPAMDMMRDVAEGRIDVGLVWGPFAGWAVTHLGLPLRAAFLEAKAGHPRLDYALAMGVRPGDTAWSQQLAAAAREHAPEIQKILVDAGVPLLDAQGKILSLPTAPEPVAEPANYRLDRYRDATPATVAGGKVIDTGGLRTLMEGGRAVLIDVLPAPRKPPEMKDGTPWSPVHDDIPGSIWLPEMGQGVLSEAAEAWFRERLRQLTGGDMDRPVVFYCLEQCWMSWNAAKRAASFGLRDVRWYRGGTDAWQRENLKLARAAPETPPE